MGKKPGFDLAEFRDIPLPSESEIMAGWMGDAEKPVVSVLCNTYNQDIYIEDAIRGFLIQKTDFPFEVIIHDDASIDNNAEIIRRYADKYSSVIKPIVQEINQYSRGKKPSVLSFQYAKGRYVALCEGDDFWISRVKLKKQFDIMESTPEASLLISPGFMMTSNGLSRRMHCCHSSGFRFYTTQDVLNIPGQFAPTASYFMRREVLETLPGWFSSVPVGDLFIELWATTLGSIAYSPEPASVYRVQADGSWSSGMRVNAIDKIKAQRDRTLCCLELFRQQVGCEELSFDVKKASWSLGLAIEFLKKKDYQSFQSNIEDSVNEFRFLSAGQRVLYQFRKLPAFLYFGLKMVRRA